MATLREIIDEGGLNPGTRHGDAWQEQFGFNLDCECRVVKDADTYTVYEFEGGWLWDGPTNSFLSGEDEDGWFNLECIADHGEGDERVWLYRDVSDGAIHLSNNAVTKELVEPDQRVGPGWDDLDIPQWLTQLDQEFGTREAAVAFARAALGESRIEQALEEEG